MAEIKPEDCIVNCILKDGVRLMVHEDMFNPVYRPYFYDTSDLQIFYGGGSSGKSTFVFQTVPLNMLMYGRNYLIALKEKNKHQGSCYTEVCRAIRSFNLDKYFDIKLYPDMTIRCPLTGAMAKFVGLENVEMLKSIVPENGAWTDIILEEATNTSMNDFEQLRIRQRGKQYDENNNLIQKRFYMMFNPLSKNHWIYKRFFNGKWNEGIDKERHFVERMTDEETGETADINIKILKTTYKDNKFLTKQDIANLLSTKDKNRFNVYVLGNFGALGKTIFEKNVNWFEEEGLREKIPTLPGHTRQGIDFGGGIANYAYVKLKYDREGKTIYIYDDFASAEVNTEQFWECIEDKTKGCGYINTERDVDKVSQIRRLGANTQPARKGSKSVSTGLQWLKSNKIIVDSRCKSIIANLELYSWKKNAQGEYIEVPEDVNNDSIDALRYAMSYDIMGKLKTIKSSLSVY